jgi:hypothetical protein
MGMGMGTSPSITIQLQPEDMHVTPTLHRRLSRRQSQSNMMYNVPPLQRQFLKMMLESE